MMKGDGVIVVRLENSHNFHEHQSLMAARAEAHRLARSVGGTFAIYVPVALVEQTPPTQETPVNIADAQFDDLPF